MPSYTVITPIERQAYQDAYEIYVNSQAELSAAFDVPGNPFFGFRISKLDYLALLSIIGVDKWTFRFAYKDNKFAIIIQGMDTNGQAMTPIFLLNDPIYSPIPLVPPTKSKEFGDIVPPILVTNWVHSWNNLVTETQIPQSFFQTSYGILRGYNFSAMDITEVFTQSEYDVESINVLFINHSVEREEGQSQFNIPGYFGLMLGNMAPSGQYNSHFYDLSAPCPPTCL